MDAPDLEPIPNWPPPVPAPPPPPPPPGTRTRTRPLVRVGAGLLGAALVVGLVAVAVRGGRPSAREHLEAVRAFLAEDSSAHFKANLDLNFGGGQEVGSEYSSRIRGEGDIVLPNRSRYVLDAGQAVYEAVVVEGAAYTREAIDAESLPGELWDYQESTGAEAGEGVGGPELIYDFSGTASALGVEPVTIRRIVDRLRDPERLESGAIRASLSLAEAFPDRAEDLEGTTGTLTVELAGPASGRLDRMIWTMEGRYEPTGGDEDVYDEHFGTFRYISFILFSKWGDPVTIEAPDDADVANYDEDYEFPEQDPDELIRFDAAPLLAPTVLPHGFALYEAYVENDEDCPEAVISYSDPVKTAAWEEIEEDVARPPDITIWVVAPNCAEDSFGYAVGTDDPPWSAGAYSGHISRGVDYGDLPPGQLPGNSVLLVINDAALYVFSNLPESDLAAAVASLAPIDAKSLVAGLEPG